MSWEFLEFSSVFMDVLCVVIDFLRDSSDFPIVFLLTFQGTGTRTRTRTKTPSGSLATTSALWDSLIDECSPPLKGEDGAGLSTSRFSFFRYSSRKG